MKNWRFSTNISLYLENGTRYGHSYNGRPSTADSFAVSCIGLGWVGSIFLDLRWVGLGWITQLMGWAGSGHRKWTHGQLWGYIHQRISKPYLHLLYVLVLSRQELSDNSVYTVRITHDRSSNTTPHPLCFIFVYGRLLLRQLR